MKKINVLLVLVMVVFVATLAGCKKTSAVVDKPVASETVSSEETSSEVSEEPSEEVSEEVSEEPSEETKEVEEVNFSNANELVEHFKSTNETAIVECNFSQTGSSQFVIPNGSNYTMQMAKSLMIIPAKEVSTIESNVDNVKIGETPTEYLWLAVILTTGTDIEVSATIKYADGTEEDILLYVTNTFE